VAPAESASNAGDPTARVVGAMKRYQNTFRAHVVLNNRRVFWISSKCFNLTPPKFSKFLKFSEKCRHGIRSFKKLRFSGPCFITCFQIVRLKFLKFS
jgi:hypothetical protein